MKVFRKAFVTRVVKKINSHYTTTQKVMYYRIKYKQPSSNIFSYKQLFCFNLISGWKSKKTQKSRIITGKSILNVSRNCVNSK